MEHNLLIRNILRVYLPIVMLMSFTSTIATFINKFLAAIWLTGEDVVLITVPTILTLYISVTGSMVATGSSIIFSRYLAKGEREKAANSYSIAVYTALAIGTIFLVICLLYAWALWHNIEIESDLVSADYIAALGVSAIPLLILLVMIMFLRMDGDKYLALGCFVVYVVVDIAVVWITVQNGLGAFGVGIAVAVGSAAALILPIFHRRIKDRNMVLRKPFDLWKGMVRISKIGLRSILNRVCMTVRYYFLYDFLAISSLGIKASYIAQNAVLHFVIAVFMGAAIMSSILSGTLYADGDRKSVCDSIREASYYSMGIAVLVAAAVLIFSEDITNLLVLEEANRESGLWCLRWFALSIPTTTLCMILIYAYQATKRKIMASVLVVVRGVILLALAVLALAPFLGESAVWTCFILADLCMLVLVVATSWIHNRRFPRDINDLLMLHGKKFDNPSVFEGSIHNDRNELKDLLVKLERVLSENSIDEDTARDALGRIDKAVGEIIDNGYSDSKIHQIDVHIRKDNGLNIVIRDDSEMRADASDGLRHANSLDMNISYIDIPEPDRTA